MIDRTLVPGEAKSLTADRMLLFTVFVTGACVLVIEIVGTRLLAPFFGSGIYTWSALIAITLAALASGYWLGGSLADRRPDHRWLYAMCLAAGCWTLLMPPLARLVLPALIQVQDLRVGVLAAGVLLFFPNLFLLGTMGPFAIRLLTHQQAVVGTTSGLVFAVSTLGSLIGALATGFILIPRFGVQLIFSCTGAVLLMLALAGNRRLRFLGAAAALLAFTIALVLLLGRATPKQSSVEVLEYAPSFYGNLHVVRNHDQVALLADGIGQNYFQVQGRWTTAYINFLITIPAMRGMPADHSRKGLVIGLGAGQLPVLLQQAGLQMDVVEIDPAVGALATRVFGFNLPAERVHYMDGRQFLARSSERFDYIVLDAFNGEQIAWHLTSREALAQAAARLTPDGVLAINLASVSDGADVASLRHTLRAVFPYVRTFSEAGSAPVESLEFLASMQPLTLDLEPVHNTPARLRDVLGFIQNELDDLAGGILLTDDFNPINEQRKQIHLKWREMMRVWAGDDLSWLLF